MSIEKKLMDLGTRLKDYINSQDSRTFVRWSLLLYFVFVAVTIAFHEIWFDEMQAWLIAKDSNSLSELFQNLSYDGHPLLWYIPLYLLSRITHNPAAMQFLHLVIATFAAYVFLKFASFTRLQKLLFIFGYFPVYEYAVISRNYAIGIFFIFLFCALFRPGPNKNYLVLSIVLFLLAQTSAYGLIVAVSLAAMLVFEFLTDRNLQVSLSDKKTVAAFCVCLILLGFFLSNIVMTPKSDGLYAGTWAYNLDLKHFPETLKTVWNGFVPIPRLDKYCYWDTNVLPGKTLPDFLSFFILCFVLMMFVRVPLIFFLFSFGTVMILATEHFIYRGYLRHHGHLFILFIACLWLSKYCEKEKDLKSPLPLRAAKFCSTHRMAFFNILLSIHFAVGIFASGMDWFFPFSTGRAAAYYIKDNGMDKLPIVGDCDVSVPVIAGYLDCSVYYPRRDRISSFAVFDKNRFEYLSEHLLFTKAQKFAEDRKSDVLIVLNHELKMNSSSLTKLKEFQKSIWPIENFYLYLLKHTNSRDSRNYSVQDENRDF